MPKRWQIVTTNWIYNKTPYVLLEGALRGIWGVPELFSKRLIYHEFLLFFLWIDDSKVFWRQNLLPLFLLQFCARYFLPSFPAPVGDFLYFLTGIVSEFFQVLEKVCQNDQKAWVDKLKTNAIFFYFFKDSFIKRALALISELYWGSIKFMVIFKDESVSPIIERVFQKIEKTNKK